MITLKLTDTERLYIYNAWNGRSMKFYSEEPTIGKINRYEDLDDFTNNQKFVNDILEAIHYRQIDIIIPTIELNELIHKLKLLKPLELRQLRNEIFTFWNQKEVMELEAYCKLLITNNRVFNIAINI